MVQLPVSETSKLPRCQVCGDDAEVKYIDRRGGVLSIAAESIGQHSVLTGLKKT